MTKLSQYTTPGIRASQQHEPMILLRVGIHLPQRSHWYRVADTQLASTTPLRTLAPYAIEAPSAPEFSANGARRAPHADPDAWVQRGSARLGHRTVGCASTTGWLRLRVQGVDDIYVATDGDSTICYDYTTSPAAELETPVVEALVGPALMLALAAAGRFCLHASAARIQGTLVAFCGDSGAGKSTLAGTGLDGWSRVSDDILPVRLDSGRCLALPHYPQLKLAPEVQYPAAAAPKLPVAALFMLAPPAGGDLRPVTCRALTPGQALVNVVRHTVAATLFPPELLGEHLRFCARVAELVPAYELAYARRWEVLPAVQRIVEQCVAHSTEQVPERHR